MPHAWPSNANHAQTYSATARDALCALHVASVPAIVRIMYQFSYSRPVQIADGFCGAGGSSTGLAQACDELAVDYQLFALNHWDRAIESHTANHPAARHFLMDIEAAKPEIAPNGVDVAWFSPSCQEHSYAHGDSSIDDEDRASAFDIPRLAGVWQPGVIIVENVAPFVKWSPVEPLRHANGKPRRDPNGKPVFRPIASRKGETFREWFAAVEACGPTYRGEWKLLNSADFGESQNRVRFFAVFTAPGVEFAWPELTHDRYGRNGLPVWEPASKYIDTTLPSQSIFGRKRPLSPSTMTRIAAGIPLVADGALQDAFLVILRKHSDVAPIAGPVPTITAGGTHIGLAQTEIHRFNGGTSASFTLGQHGGAMPRRVNEPIATIATDAYIRVFELIAEGYRSGTTALVGDSAETLEDFIARFDGRVAEIDGALYGLDVKFRMLQPVELKQFQGLGPDYVLKGTKGEQNAQIGNAVPVKVAKALGRQALIAIRRAQPDALAA